MMKKTLSFIALIILTITVLTAQNEVDALRYSQSFHGGSARFMSMGGAFGALGADPSTLTINPAGLGVYRKSEFTFTPTFYLGETSSNFMDNISVDHKYNFNFNNMAIVGVSNTGNKDGWISVNFGFGYNKVNNFNNRVVIEGQNNDNSITDYFVELANGNTSDNLNFFNEGLGWDAYLIDHNINDTTNTTYQSALLTRGVLQSKSITSKGSIGEYDFSIGANYDNTLYFGATVGIVGIRYKEDSEFSEEDPDTMIYDFNSLTYRQHLLTRGTGFNFKFGLLYRPVDWIRIGGAIHTPTFFTLTDKYSSEMLSDFESTKWYVDSYSGDTVIYDEQLIESPEGISNYQLTTPFKAIGSLALVIKKTAIISIDYEFIDYSLARLRDDKDPFITENNSIQNHYTIASNIRAGLEYRYGPFSFRGGYALYGNPYNTAEVDNDGTITAYSGGFGIRDKEFYFDIAYVYTTKSEKYYMYSPDVVSIDAATLNATTSRVMATFGFRF